MTMLPCWIVDVRHERRSGHLGHFKSRPVTLTEARRLAREYQGLGHPTTIRCVEELATLHRAMIRGELNRNEAVIGARDLGYDVT